jgi:hypothetical protein
MDRAEEYRRRAEEVEGLAKAATSEADRAAFEKIAREWRDLEATALRRMHRP